MSVLFSIIIPTFNSSATIHEALQSMAAQTFTNFEVIIIDGVSADDTLNIVNGYNQHLQLLILSEPDNGIYDAMNKGVDMANGQWLYFMGSDDRLYNSNVLENVAAELSGEPADLLYGKVEETAPVAAYPFDTPAKVLGIGLPHQSIFFRASLFTDKQIGKYDTRFKVAADYFFTMKVFLTPSLKTRYINLIIAQYGPAGYSSRNFDYQFYSYRYKLISKLNGLKAVGELGNTVLVNSIYCCYQLAMQKQHTGFAWNNLLYYVFTGKGLSLSFRLKTLLRMLRWSFKTGTANATTK